MRQVFFLLLAAVIAALTKSVNFVSNGSAIAIAKGVANAFSSRFLTKNVWKLPRSSSFSNFFG